MIESVLTCDDCCSPQSTAYQQQSSQVSTDSIIRGQAPPQSTAYQQQSSQVSTDSIIRGQAPPQFTTYQQQSSQVSTDSIIRGQAPPVDCGGACPLMIESVLTCDDCC
jgi:hypothetical protein